MVSNGLLIPHIKYQVNAACDIKVRLLKNVLNQCQKYLKRLF